MYSETEGLIISAILVYLSSLLGLENAERNVLPTLNNLLENREMSLDDGRFLMPRPPHWTGDPDEKLVFVHEDFRVVGLSVPVPSYAGRALDPPLRSRFQCRFVDQPPSDLLLASANTSGVPRKSLLALVQFYESLRGLRDSSIEEDASLASLPLFPQEAFGETLDFLRCFPAASPLEAVERLVPAVSWMADVLPERLQHPVQQAAGALGGGEGKTQATKKTKTKTKRKGKEPFGGSAERAAYALQSMRFPFSSAAEGAEKTGELRHSVTFSSPGHEDVTLAAVCGEKAPLAGVDNVAVESKLLPRQCQVMGAMMADHCLDKHTCLLGPKGCGKSVVAREFARVLGYSAPRVFPLYRELTARDLLQRRVTDTAGNTSWADSPLIRAAREGKS